MMDKVQKKSFDVWYHTCLSDRKTAGGKNRWTKYRHPVLSMSIFSWQGIYLTKNIHPYLLHTVRAYYLLVMMRSSAKSV